MAPLQAVLDEELSEFLDSIGLLGDIKAGKVNCKFCGETISLENLHAVFPDSGNISVACSNPECVHKMNYYLFAQES